MFNDFSGGFASKDRGADCDPASSRPLDASNIGIRDPTDGKNRKLYLPQDGFEAIGSQEGTRILGGGFENRSGADIVSTFSNSLPCLLKRMGREPHQEAFPDDAPGLRQGKVFLPEVDPIGVAQEGDIRPVVDNKQGPGACTELPKPSRT
ncbi:uncharacterized protein METZ01_LOCUS510925, partial [marine metagenome]